MNYVSYDETGQRSKIVCRKCGQIIADKLDVAVSNDSRTGRTTSKLVFMPLTNYTTVKLLLSNNAQINCALCKACAKTLSREEIDQLYQSEIEAIKYDGDIRGRKDQVARVVAGLRTLKVSRRIS